MHRTRWHKNCDCSLPHVSPNSLMTFCFYPMQIIFVFMFNVHAFRSKYLSRIILHMEIGKIAWKKTKQIWVACKLYAVLFRRGDVRENRNTIYYIFKKKKKWMIITPTNHMIACHSLDTHHNSVWCNCCCALMNESDANWLSRVGWISICDPIDWKCFLEKRFRLKLCLTFMTWAWLSEMLRKPSTHSWRARALAARNFNVSPEAQLTVNVRESSSLGQITAPAKCSWKWTIEKMLRGKQCKELSAEFAFD